MKVSIITVAYNAEETIADALKSVAAQSYANIEHIVIDGASKDRTAEIVKTHSGRLVRFVSEPDKGIYDAMNKGLKWPQVNWSPFSMPTTSMRIETLCKRCLQQCRSPISMRCSATSLFFNPSRPGKLTRRYRSDRFLPSRIAWGWMPAHPALFLRDRVLREVGYFDASYKIAGDFELIARIFKDESLRYQHLPEVLVHMRTGGVSTMGWRNTIRLNREVLRACHENGIYTNAAMILSKYPLKILEFHKAIARDIP